MRERGREGAKRGEKNREGGKRVSGGGANNIPVLMLSTSNYI